MRRLALALLLLGAACSGPSGGGPAGRVVIVTRVPEGAAVGDDLPSGSQLVRLDLDADGGAPLVLSEGLDAAGHARLSHDARRVVFLGRERPGEELALWECAPDGGRRRRLTPGAAECGPGVVLPDGRVAYAATAPGGRALFVAEGDGSAGRRISFGAPVLSGPEVTRDGRLAFVARTTPRRATPPVVEGAILTVHPDGTGVTLLHLAGADWPATLRQAPTDGAVVHALPAGGGPGRAHLIDWRAPAEVGEAITLPTGPAACVEPMADGALLVAAGDVAQGRSGLVLVDRAGVHLAGPWPDSEGWRTTDVVQVAERARPQGQLSSVNLDQAVGELLCVDARLGGDGLAVTAVVRAGRAVEATPAAWEWATLGETPLAADGSFFAQVPADTPLLVDLHDAAGSVLVASRTPFWVRPGEKRACVGCHEPPDSTPPNHRPLAVLAPPVPLGRATGSGPGQGPGDGPEVGQ